MLLLIDVVKLFCRDGICSMLDALLERRCISGASGWSGNAHA
jgi:hypothetical protein